MKFENKSIGSKQDNLERLLMNLHGRIESLKTQFNLYFAGELRVPPEKEREDLEKIVRDVTYSSPKSPRTTLLVQNVASKFSLYNNMWKKRLNEIESGMIMLKKKPTAYMEDIDEPKKKKKKIKPETLDLSLNREDSFDKFYDRYSKLLDKDPGDDKQREKVINSLKTKMISQNLIDAHVSLSVSEGKLKLKIKR